MNLAPIIQSDVSQKEKDKYLILMHIMWNLERWYRQSYMQGSKEDTDGKNRLLDSVGEGEGGLIWENSTETYTLPDVKQITSANLMCDAGHPKPVLCDSLMDGRGGRRVFRMEGTHECLWPLHIDVWQKPSQYSNYRPIKMNKCI